jgi:hypothetical protein
MEFIAERKWGIEENVAATDRLGYPYVAPLYTFRFS